MAFVGWMGIQIREPGNTSTNWHSIRLKPFKWLHSDNLHKMGREVFLVRKKAFSKPTLFVWSVNVR